MVDKHKPCCMVCGATLTPEFIPIGLCGTCTAKVLFTVERRNAILEQGTTTARRSGG